MSSGQSFLFSKIYFNFTLFEWLLILEFNFFPYFV